MQTHGTKVILQQAISAPVTEGGIVLPESTKQKLPTGTIICMGSDVKCGPLGTGFLGIGTRVQFNAYSGSAIVVNGQDYLVLDEEDILVILEATDV